MTDDGLVAFATELQQEIILTAEIEEAEALRSQTFTERMIEELTDAGELDDGHAHYYRAHGVEASGYSLSSDDDTLDLFVTLFKDAVPPVTVKRAEVAAAFKRLVSFYEKARSGLHLYLEEASPAFDMALQVHDFALKGQLHPVRLFLFTDGLTTVDVRPTEQLDDVSISYHIWDIRRLYRLVSSGRNHEPIEINFVQRFGRPLPCLAAPTEESDYSAFLTIVPGEILEVIYDDYGPRLLERNVRSFLQARGKVNKQMRKTILEEPERFLAYNNGISATASRVELAQLPEGGVGITSVSDLQIVNGGQTTASVHSAARRDKAEVGRLSVQAKLTVLAPNRVDEVVPLISRYANSQNKVNEADFYANGAFHVQVEKYSRSIWAPAKDGTQRQTKWFYERARGQYQDSLAREGTPARRRHFKAIYPSSQKFTKTDLAKFENTWSQLPHLVSLGAEKNFREFATRLAERGGRSEATQQYFQRLVAKAILFRTSERIVSAQNFGGYRANIVTYSMAYLCHRVSSRIDLDRIWLKQSLSPTLVATIEAVCHSVHAVLTDPPGRGNVTEWCKKAACWKRIQEIDVELPSRLEDELISISRDEMRRVDRGISGPDTEEAKLIVQASAVPAETWFRISNWAKETGNLEPWQRSLAYNLGRVSDAGRDPSYKQATQGLRLLEEARRLGFP